jgi:hypothetical protein
MELKSFDVFPKIANPVREQRLVQIFHVIKRFEDGKNVPIAEKKVNEVHFWFSEFLIKGYQDDRGLKKDELNEELSTKNEESYYDHDARYDLAIKTYKHTRERFLEGCG